LPGVREDTLGHHRETSASWFFTLRVDRPKLMRLKAKGVRDGHGANFGADSESRSRPPDVVLAS